ncbi:aminotransferase class V-fold PLP-dependent enzyme [Alloalcanivorax xenomutans]|uniref:aminotransferase class V-fold PLP-dependent enzyme n=1 Tax=Alloalcanivorax xenomutans TaxID=1094342 RepID=UPI0009B60534|nr:aminotransferase class V-fold PLP-dependent enzyme [Alloalcanivorax xenomutans]ARB46226.1 class V aminotransferase [Alloalcanivorax xenomutans]
MTSALDLSAEFPLENDVLYLNHAPVAPWPKRTRDAVVRFAEQNITVGARDYPRWLDTEQTLRGRLAALIGGVPHEDIALLKNTSEGLSVIAQGLSWRDGDQVLISDQEFPSNRIPWQALAEQGVEVIQVPVDGDNAEQRVIDALGPRVRLVSLSSVQYASGIRLDLAPIGAACRERGVLFCVDAIQSLGAHVFDAESINADFVVADGHKWMLGPEGLALFYARPEARDRLRLRQFGWHMVAASGDYDRQDWRPADDARRFECGSPNLLCAHALNASLSLLEEVGMAAVEQRLTDTVTVLIGELKARGAELLTPEAARRRAGIVTFRLPGEEPQSTFERLRQGGVVCAQRGGGVRFSPHFHTDQSVIDRALALL